MTIDFFKHLLPRAEAWSLVQAKQLRDFFQGLVGSKDDLVSFMDDVWADLFPATTRELTAWEQAFGIFKLSLSEAERRTRLDGLWKATGGQSPRYIQDTLQNAGFDAYVHEWWETNLLVDGNMEASGTGAWSAGDGASLSKETISPRGGTQVLRITDVNLGNARQSVLIFGDTYRAYGFARGDGGSAPIVRSAGSSAAWTGTTSTAWQEFDVQFLATGGQFILEKDAVSGYVDFDSVTVETVPRTSPPTVRNPYTALGAFVLGCGDPEMECGEPLAACGSTTPQNGYMLVNKIYTTRTGYTCLCGEALMECGEATAACGENTGVIFERVDYPVPSDPNQWPYILYIGGETFPDQAIIASNRIEEFEDLLLKICPAQLWIALLVSYQATIIEDATGFDVIEDASGDLLIEVI